MPGAHLDLHAPARLDEDTRLFASARDEQRLRRPLDGITAIVAALALATLAWWAQPTLGFERALVEAVTSSPAWLHDLWVIAYDVVALLAAVAILATIVRHRWPLLLQCLVSGVTAAVLVQLVTRYTSGQWASVEHVLGWGEAVAWPAAGITVSCAILLALTADVTAPVRSTRNLGDRHRSRDRRPVRADNAHRRHRCAAGGGGRSQPRTPRGRDQQPAACREPKRSPCWRRSVSPTSSWAGSRASPTAWC